MTDEQIIKALECCIKLSLENCKACPYYRFGHGCLKKCLLEALDLINRLKQENEELKRDAKYSEEFKKIVEKYTGGKP